jgi:hypothetical protein
MATHTIHTQTFRGVAKTYASAQAYSKAWEIDLPDDFYLARETNVGVEFESRKTGEKISLLRIQDDICHAMSERDFTNGLGYRFPIDVPRFECANLTFAARRVQ